MCFLPGRAPLECFIFPPIGFCSLHSGTRLREKILEPFVNGPLRANALTKPIALYIITDGAPYPESGDVLKDAILESHALAQNADAAGAFAVEIVQVGTDDSATEYLESFEPPQHGKPGDARFAGKVDICSDYEVEVADWAEQGNQMTPATYLAKMILSAIDPKWAAMG